MNPWIFAEQKYQLIPLDVFNRLERITYDDGQKTWELAMNGCWEIARRELCAN